MNSLVGGTDLIGRHTGQSSSVQFLQWYMIWRDEAQWGTNRITISIDISKLHVHVQYM